MSDFEERMGTEYEQQDDSDDSMERIAADYKENPAQQAFTQAYDGRQLDRFEAMPREEANRKLLSFDTENQQLVDRINTLDAENRRMRQMLRMNGIPFVARPSRHHA